MVRRRSIREAKKRLDVGRVDAPPAIDTLPIKRGKERSAQYSPSLDKVPKWGYTNDGPGPKSISLQDQHTVKDLEGFLQNCNNRYVKMIFKTKGEYDVCDPDMSEGYYLLENGISKSGKVTAVVIKAATGHNPSEKVSGKQIPVNELLQSLRILRAKKGIADNTPSRLLNNGYVVQPRYWFYDDDNSNVMIIHQSCNPGEIYPFLMKYNIINNIKDVEHFYFKSIEDIVVRTTNGQSTNVSTEISLTERTQAIQNAGETISRTINTEASRKGVSPSATKSAQKNAANMLLDIVNNNMSPEQAKEFMRELLFSAFNKAGGSLSEDDLNEADMYDMLDTIGSAFEDVAATV